MLSLCMLDRNDQHTRYSLYLDGANIGTVCVLTKDAEFLEGAFAPSIDGRHCPHHLTSSLRNYCDLGIPTGDFLKSVLSNDLKQAVARADDRNIHLLRHIVAWCYNHLPYNVWGSPEDVAHHLERKAKEREDDQ